MGHSTNTSVIIFSWSCIRFNISISTYFILIFLVSKEIFPLAADTDKKGRKEKEKKESRLRKNYCRETESKQQFLKKQ